MSKNENKITLNEHGLIALNDLSNVSEEGEIPSNDNDVFYEDDIASFRLIINSTNNLKLEVKYPNVEKLKLSSSLFKQIYYKVKPLKVNKSHHNEATAMSLANLCETILGIYPMLAFDSNKKDYKIIVHGFLPNKFTFKHDDQLKIGNKINIILLFF
jgi:hypothetical protein